MSGFFWPDQVDRIERLRVAADLKLTDEWMADFPDDERRKILFGNVERLCHL